MKIEPIKQSSLGEQVAAELRRLIATRAMTPGTTVTEEALATQFRLSRGPVREAIRMLTAEGLLEAHGRATVIRGVSTEDVDELFSLRFVLESAAVELAMQRNQELLVRLLDESIEEMEHAANSGSAEAFADADLRFHSSLYVVAGHRRLQAIWDQYRPSIHLILLVSRKTYEDLAPSVEYHYRLRDLISSGDVDAVRADLAEHLDNARGRVRAFYAAELPATLSGREPRPGDHRAR